MRYPLINRDENLFNRFDIVYETNIHIAEEDELLIIFHKFLSYLYKNSEVYEINPNDLIIIEAVIDNKLNIDKKDKENSLKKLFNIANENNLEALYKYNCLIKNENNKEETEKRFKLLFNKNIIEAI